MLGGGGPIIKEGPTLLVKGCSMLITISNTTHSTQLLGTVKASVLGHLYNSTFLNRRHFL